MADSISAATARENGSVRAGVTKVDEDLIDALLRASRAMVGVAARSLSSSTEEVTLPQYRTLVVLAYQGPKRLADLAEALRVSPSTATRMCDRLVRKGFIHRTRDAYDRREVNLSLTAPGSALVESVMAARRHELHVLLEAIPRPRVPQLVEVLNLLADTLGEEPEHQVSAGWSAPSDI